MCVLEWINDFPSLAHKPFCSLRGSPHGNEHFYFSSLYGKAKGHEFQDNVEGEKSWKNIYQDETISSIKYQDLSYDYIT